MMTRYAMRDYFTCSFVLSSKKKLYIHTDMHIEQWFEFGSTLSGPYGGGSCHGFCTVMGKMIDVFVLNEADGFSSLDHEPCIQSFQSTDFISDDPKRLAMLPKKPPYLTTISNHNADCKLPRTSDQPISSSSASAPGPGT